MADSIARLKFKSTNDSFASKFSSNNNVFKANLSGNDVEFSSKFSDTNSTFKSSLSTKPISILEPATKQKLGGVIVGDNLNITDNGVLSVNTTDDISFTNKQPITSKGVSVHVGSNQALTNLEIDKLLN